MTEIKTWKERLGDFIASGNPVYNLVKDWQLQEAMQDEIDALRAQVGELESKVQHWKQARQNALDAGDLMKAELTKRDIPPPPHEPTFNSFTWGQAMNKEDAQRAKSTCAACHGTGIVYGGEVCRFCEKEDAQAMSDWLAECSRGG